MAVKVGLTTFLAYVNLNLSVISSPVFLLGSFFVRNLRAVDLGEASSSFSHYCAVCKFHIIRGQKHLNSLVWKRVMAAYNTCVYCKYDTNVFTVHGKCVSLRKCLVTFYYLSTMGHLCVR